MKKFRNKLRPSWAKQTQLPDSLLVLLLWFQTKSAQLEEMDSNLRRLRKCLKQMSDLKVKSFTNSTFFRKHTVGLFSGRLFKERDLGYVINQGMECHKLGKYIVRNQRIIFFSIINFISIHIHLSTFIYLIFL